MDFATAIKTIRRVWASDPTLTICLLGPPGIGKSTIGAKLAEMGKVPVGSPQEALALNNMYTPSPEDRAVCEIVDLTSRLPEDLGGIPYREDGTLHYTTQAWMQRVMDADKAVVVLDDIAAAPPSIAVAARQLVLDRRLHDDHLHDGVNVLVTGNRAKDRSRAKELPAHFRNAVVMLELEPNLTDWASWYTSHSEWTHMIPRFLTHRPEFLSQTPDQASANGSYATPRSWAMLARAISGKDAPKDTVTVGTLAKGAVGEGPAMEFMAFLTMSGGLVSPDKVWERPREAMPDPAATLDTNDKKVSMISGVALYGRSKLRENLGQDGSLDGDLLAQTFRALAWVCQDHAEGMMLATTHLFQGFNISQYQVVRTTLGIIPEMEPFRQQVREALRQSVQEELAE